MSALSNPKIAIIVPVFNQERFIGRCIRSLLAQNFPRVDYEIVIVDDGCTDKTPFAISIFDDEVTIIKNERNIGLPGSLNRAINRIKSSHFVRVDSDDFVSNNFLLFLYSFITENSYMDAVACDYNLVDDQENVIERKSCISEPIACGIAFNTKQVINLGGYDENFLLHEDLDLRTRFLEHHEIHRLELPLYRYRRHDNNMTNNKEAMEFHKKNLVAKHNNVKGIK